MSFDADPVSDFLAREQNALAGLNMVDKDLVISPPQSEIKQEELSNGFDAFYSGNQRDENNGSASFHSIPSPTPMAEEPEKIRKWREQQKKKIEEKDQAEEKCMQELRSQAEKELKEWNEQRKARLEQRKTHNRDAEAKYLEAIDSKNSENANSWEQIAKLVEGSGSSSKSSKSCAIKDTSRMKSLIIAKRSDQATNGT